jgi:hypothetical protein
MHCSESYGGRSAKRGGEVWWGEIWESAVGGGCANLSMILRKSPFEQIRMEVEVVLEVV